MSVLQKIAFLQGNKSEEPNIALAKELVLMNDIDGIKEIAVNLHNPETGIQNDCVKVIYEVGYIKPELIAPYASDFLKLLWSRNNRMIWGAMTALSCVSKVCADEIFEKLDVIMDVIDKGSVITVDSGIRVLAGVASAEESYNKKVFPLLLSHLKTCRPKEVAQHAESSLPAVNAQNIADFLQVLKKREDALTPSQVTRIRKIMRQAEKGHI